MYDDSCDDDVYWSHRRHDYIVLFYYCEKFKIPTFITLPPSRADDEADLRRRVQWLLAPAPWWGLLFAPAPEVSSAGLRRRIGSRPFTVKLLQGRSAYSLYRHVRECHPAQWSSLRRKGELP